MGLTTTLRNRLRAWLSEGAKAAPVLDVAPWQTGSQAAQRDMPSLSVTGQQEMAYTWSPWVYAAVTRVAVTAAETPLQVYRQDGERAVALDNHPFEQLLHHPNPVDSRQELLEALFSFLALTGNAYLWLNRASENAPPEELFVIPSRELRPHPDGRLSVDGYEYYPDGRIEPLFFPPWQIAHVKRFNPLSRFAGLSPVELAAATALTDKYQRQWNLNNFGKHNAKVPGVLAFPDPIPDPLWAKIKDEFYRDTGGTARQVMLMRNTGPGTPKWIPTHLTQAEMEFLESRRFNKEEIFDLFAPGLAAMTAINATEATARTAKATYMDLTVWPMLSAVAEKITNTVLPAYGPNLVAAFDDVRVTDRAMAAQEYATYSPDLSLNENRKTQRKEPLKGDLFEKVPVRLLAQLDAGFVTEQVAQALGLEYQKPRAEAPAPGSPSFPLAPTPPAPTPPTETPGERLLAVPVPQENLLRGAAKADADVLAWRDDLRKWKRKAAKRGACDFESAALPAWLQAAVKARLDTQPATAFDFLKAHTVTLEDEYRERLAALYADVLAGELQAVLDAREPDLSAFYQQLHSVALDVFTRAIADDLLAQALDLGIGFDYDAMLTEASQWATRKAGELMKRVSDTDRAHVRDLIGKLANRELSREDAQSILTRTFGPVRAEMISATELTAAYHQASEMYKRELSDLGLDTDILIETAEDERVCPLCGPLDHKGEAVWRAVSPGGPPFHIRCRCRSVVTAKRKRAAS